MRRIVLNLAISLDGYIEGPKGEYDWCMTDADYGMTDFMNSIDTVIMGAKSYRLLLQYGAPYPEFKNIVFSRSQQTSEYANVEFVNSNIPEYVTTLRSKRGKNIWLFGGAEIVSILLENDLIDEMTLSVHPLLLGDGRSLFPIMARRKLFKLKDTIQYPSGLVQLLYTKHRTD